MTNLIPDSDLVFVVAGVALGVALVVAVVVGVLALTSAGCSARWERSGLQTSWGPIQGCLVQVPDGRWVPSDNVRGVDLRGDLSADR